jgi:DNA-binding YbaB/EbfC family protein
MPKGKPPKRRDEGMMASLQKMQEELARAQSDLDDQTIEASAGGGAVKVVMSGTQECRSVTIAPALFESGDASMLQDLMMLAVNQAIQDSQLLAARRLGPLTGGLAPGGPSQ